MNETIDDHHIDVDYLPWVVDGVTHAVMSINQRGGDEQVCVWVTTEGTGGLMAWTCGPRNWGFSWASDMVRQRIALKTSVTGCSCAASDKAICTFGTFDDEEPQRVMLTRIAERAGFGPLVDDMSPYEARS